MNIHIELDSVVTYISIISMMLLALNNYLICRSINKLKKHQESDKKFILDQMNFNLNIALATQFFGESLEVGEVAGGLEEMFINTHASFKLTKISEEVSSKI